MVAKRGCEEETKRMKGEDNETEEDEECVVTLICKSVRAQGAGLTQQGPSGKKERKKKKESVTGNKVGEISTHLYLQYHKMN